MGYSDGTMAFYNINNVSPLLLENENGTSIFYPYTEERVHNSCMTGEYIFFKVMCWIWLLQINAVMTIVGSDYDHFNGEMDLFV